MTRLALTAALCAVLSTAVCAPAQVTLKDRLQNTAAATSLDNPVLKPWHLRVSFQLFDQYGRAGETGSFDYASSVGNNSHAYSGLDGNFDSASTVGNDAGSEAGFQGSFDTASATGNDALAEAGLGTAAVPANFDFASDWGTLTTIPSVATVEALHGSGDTAFVVDPFGTIGSEAFAGFGGNFDLAGAWGDDLAVLSTLADFIFHIGPLF